MIFKNILLLITCILIITSIAEQKPANIITIQTGGASFYSDLKNQSGDNGGYIADIEYFRNDNLSYGINIQGIADFCPVCDISGHDKMFVFNFLTGFISESKFFSFDILTGIGFAKGINPTTDNNDNSFTTINLPFKIRPLVNLPFGQLFKLSTGLGIGLTPKFRTV